MAQYVLKILVTTALIVAISELSKRSSLVGGLLASLPLVFFLALPALLKLKLNFYLGFGLATALMLVCYGAMLVGLKKAGGNL